MLKISIKYVNILYTILYNINKYSIFAEDMLLYKTPIITTEYDPRIKNRKFPILQR